MALLTKAKVYNIEDSNIALLGSDLEKHVRERTGDKEPAWQSVGQREGLQIWRIEKFQVKPWLLERYGSFYDGDSYIVLHTYKRTSDAKSFSYDLHFWLGRNTSQDEAGTAAYKTVELDDCEALFISKVIPMIHVPVLHGTPVQWRESQGDESHRFLSYFPRFFCLQGGISTGFHHFSHSPPGNVKVLYRIRSSHGKGGRAHLVVHQVPAVADSLVEGDVYVLDKGSEILQLNTRTSAGQEKFKATEFAQSIVNDKQIPCGLTVYDEGISGVYKFFGEFGEGVQLRKADMAPLNMAETHAMLYRISDASGSLTFEIVHPVTKASLSSADAYLLDHSAGSSRPTIFVWIGRNASLNEKRMALQYAQRYLHDKKVKTHTNKVRVAIPIVKMLEGQETPEFLESI